PMLHRTLPSRFRRRKRRGREFDLWKASFAVNRLGVQFVTFLLSELHEIKLAAARFFIPGRDGPLVGTVGLLNARFRIVRQRNSQNFVNNALAQDSVLDGESQFDPADEIAREPIGATEEDLRLAGIFKIVNSTVLQEAIDNAAHGDVFAQAL